MLSLMLRQLATTLAFETRGRGLVEITRPVADWVGAGGIGDGAGHALHPPYLGQPADPGERRPDVRADLDRFFARLVPDGDALFRHRDEGPDDMPAHVRAALTATQLSIPLADGRLALGTWQGIYLWEHRLRGHRRELALHLIGD